MKRGNENGLDAVGWSILGALQENARISFAALGRRVGLTAPAAAERVRQMEDAGVIRGYRAEVGLERLGLAVTAVIRVSAPEEKCPALKACVKTLAEVVECHHVTGSDSYVLRVIATSVGHPPSRYRSRRDPARRALAGRRASSGEDIRTSSRGSSDQRGVSALSIGFQPSTRPGCSTSR